MDENSMKKQNNAIKKISKGILIIVGGAVGILFMGLFFQSPPTRAEFNTLKSTNEAEHKSMIRLFDDIKSDLNIIKGLLYEKAISNKKKH